MTNAGYARVGAIMIDCHDPAALFEFWPQIVNVEALGGARIEDHEMAEFSWTVLADPEGNEFCVTAEH